MTQRIRGISDTEATAPVKELFEASNRVLGRTADLLRILAHSPHLARWFLPLVAAVRQPGLARCPTRGCGTSPCST